MQKSLIVRDYRVLLRQLRAIRKDKNITQETLARRLGVTQSFVSKCERGERRLDVVELRAWCKGLSVPYLLFLSEFERRLRSAPR